MKKIFALIAIISLGMVTNILAETRTLSFDPVATYTDNTPITGAALPVTYDAFWTTTPNTLINPHILQSNGLATSVVFDQVTQGMVRGTIIYFSARARTAIGEVSANSPAFSWLVPNLVLSGIGITSGPSSVNEGSSGTYVATATWNDNSVTTVTPTWGVSPSTFASISSGGVLTTLGGLILSDQSVTITATYISGGVTKTATKVVTVVNSANIIPPSGFSIQ